MKEISTTFIMLFFVAQGCNNYTPSPFAPSKTPPKPPTSIVTTAVPITSPSPAPTLAIDGSSCPDFQGHYHLQGDPLSLEYDLIVSQSTCGTIKLLYTFNGGTADQIWTLDGFPFDGTAEMEQSASWVDSTLVYKLLDTSIAAVTVKQTIVYQLDSALNLIEVSSTEKTGDSSSADQTLTYLRQTQ